MADGEYLKAEPISPISKHVLVQLGRQVFAFTSSPDGSEKLVDMHTSGVLTKELNDVAPRNCLAAADTTWCINVISNPPFTVEIGVVRRARNSLTGLRQESSDCANCNRKAFLGVSWCTIRMIHPVGARSRVNDSGDGHATRHCYSSVLYRVAKLIQQREQVRPNDGWLPFKTTQSPRGHDCTLTPLQ